VAQLVDTRDAEVCKPPSAAQRVQAFEHHWGVGQFAGIAFERALASENLMGISKGTDNREYSKNS
jgi:hypothetical protein